MRLGLGTVQFGAAYGVSNKQGKVKAAEVHKILTLARNNDISVLDTAAGYGNAEEILGKNIKDNDDFLIVTKTVSIREKKIDLNSVSLIKQGFQNSIRLLGQSSIYCLMVHQSQNLLSPGGEYLFDALLELKESGLIKKIGVSVYTEQEITALLRKYAIDIVQVPINVFDQRLVHNGCLAELYKSGLEVHARSVFLQGLLLMNANEIPEYFNDHKSHHTRYLQALEESGVSPLSGALGFFSMLHEVSTVLIGVETSKQLQECIDALNIVPKLDYSLFANKEPTLIDPRLWLSTTQN